MPTEPIAIAADDKATAPCPRLDLPAPDTTEVVTVAALVAEPIRARGPKESAA